MIGSSRILAHILLVKKCNVDKMADRFARRAIDEGEFQVLLENGVPKTTEKAKKFGMKVFNGS